MSTPEVRDCFVRSVDVALGPGRATLRVSLVEGDGDSAPTVILAAGFGGAATFHRPPWLDGPIRVPVTVVADVVAALQTLAGDP